MRLTTKNGDDDMRICRSEAGGGTGGERRGNDGGSEGDSGGDILKAVGCKE